MGSCPKGRSVFDDDDDDDDVGGVGEYRRKIQNHAQTRYVAVLSLRENAAPSHSGAHSV